jgi:hypothetical protein
MVDIVNRLRDTFEHWGLGSKGPSILKEAADEIAAIRSERDSLKALCDEMAKALGEAKFALFSSDMTIKDRADQSMRLALAAYRKEKEVGNG